MWKPQDILMLVPNCLKKIMSMVRKGRSEKIWTIHEIKHIHAVVSMHVRTVCQPCMFVKKWLNDPFQNSSKTIWDDEGCITSSSFWISSWEGSYSTSLPLTSRLTCLFIYTYKIYGGISSIVNLLYYANVSYTVVPFESMGFTEEWTHLNSLIQWACSSVIHSTK